MVATAPATPVPVARVGISSGSGSNIAALHDAADGSITGKDGHSEAPSNSTKKQRKINQELQEMDPDMRQVAQLHLAAANSSGSNNSVKSLVNLKPDLFVNSVTDAARGQALVGVLWLTT